DNCAGDLHGPSGGGWRNTKKIMDAEISVLTNMIARGWENFLARPTGSLNLRFILQPTIASCLALRAGINAPGRAALPIYGRRSQTRVTVGGYSMADGRTCAPPSWSPRLWMPSIRS